MERYGLVNRANFVITVRPFTEELQAEVDFCESAESDEVFQRKLRSKRAIA